MYSLLLRRGDEPRPAAPAAFFSADDDRLCAVDGASHDRPVLLVLTTLSARSTDRLDRLAQHAAALGARLRLAFRAGQRPSGLREPIARLEQRARHLRRQHPIGVEVLPREVLHRSELERLSQQATITCLLDADERPQRRALGTDLLGDLLRWAHGPVWVVGDARHANPSGLSCWLALATRDAALLRWARSLSRGFAVQLTHVIEVDGPPAHASDPVEMTVFDHLLRERRVQAVAALDHLAAQWAAPKAPPAALVLSGHVDEQLVRHVHRTRPALVLFGHTPKPWSFSGVRARVSAVTAQGADAFVVPLRRQPLWDRWRQVFSPRSLS